MAAVEPDSSETFSELAATIQREYQATYDAALDVLSHAIACGEALIEARDNVPDGAWLSWVRANTDVSEAAAHRFVRIAAYRDRLLSAESRPRTINSAIAYLRDIGAPALYTGRTGRRPTFDVEEAKRLRAQGLTFDEIGSMLGVSDVAVWRQLTPGATQQAMRYTARARSRRRAEQRALVEMQRVEAVARVGGSAADAYALIRRAAIALDRAHSEAGNDERRELRDALSFVHRAEAAIVRALRIERQD